MERKVITIDVGKKSKKESDKLINEVRKKMGLKPIIKSNIEKWLFFDLWASLLS